MRVDYTYLDIARMIDHSLLQPNLTDQQLKNGCLLAAAYDVASVCILPYFVPRAAEILQGSRVAVGTTVGFPHGGHATAVKEAEAARAIQDGARELDMVVNISKVLGGDWDYVRRDIDVVIQVAHEKGAKVKVIFENCYLEEEHKIHLCRLCGELKADWVKTSTGFGPGGATLEDVRLMRANSPEHVRVKAAGGVRTLDALLEMRAAGATRIGASRTREILNECRLRLGLPPLQD